MISSKSVSQQHPFHIVDISPWPICTAFSLLNVTFGTTMYLHQYSAGGFLVIIGFVLLITTLINWWSDVVIESTFLGYHTQNVQSNIKVAMIVFIISEVMFFAGFFWAFFHSSLVPDINIGGVWPPKYIQTINPWGVPLLNTLILLTSGASLTWAHHSLLAKNRTETIHGLGLTLILAVIFTGFQIFEYKSATFTISDGIYGSVFYMTTGFHGFHVIIGTIFLSVVLYRFFENHFIYSHVNFDIAAWYWHFVDIVWIFLFFFIYWWGGK